VVKVELLFAQHHDALVRYLIRVTGDADLAADLAQEAFIRWIERQPAEDNPKAWLFTVATNLAKDDVRIRSRRLVLLSEAPDRAPMGAAPSEAHQALEAEERRLVVRKALDELSDRERMLLLMREEGFSHEEMAKAVGTTTKSVGTMLARAFRKLSALLVPETETDE
jgi:RNA polymerase sigma-70 factor (ECF subfamily)